MQILRFTGDFPPVEVLENLPNWEYALGEEHVSGQDETTLRPSQEQRLVTSDVAYTAGAVTLASGKKLVAILEVERCSIQGFTVHADGRWAWAMRLLGKPAKWQPLVYEWLPEKERPPSVSRSDPSVFPVSVESVLPSGIRAPLRVTVERGE